MPEVSVSLEILRTLHRIHRQLGDLKERLDRGPKQIRAVEANVKHREGELEQARAALKNLRKEADAKQLQLKSNEAKIKDLKGKLNAAATNKEYQILKDQIAADQMANSVLEDEILEEFEQIEQFQPKIAEAEQTLAGARQRSEQVHADVGKQQPLIQADIDRLEAELATAEAELPPLVNEVYQRTVRQRGEDALATLEDGACGGCHQQVPLNIQAEVRLSHPMFCRSCGRLLYLPDHGK
jgi:predicted  nucleic acid-binding Zn-ribbon protein